MWESRIGFKGGEKRTGIAKPESASSPFTERWEVTETVIVGLNEGHHSREKVDRLGFIGKEIEQ